LVEGKRYNEGKRKWGLLSFKALAELVKVLEFGAKKYDSWNWSKGLSFTETFESMQRHLVAWYNGEDNDPETGLSHMAHVFCNAMFLMHFIVTGTGKDDRYFKNNDNNTEQTEFANKEVALHGGSFTGKSIGGYPYNQEPGAGYIYKPYAAAMEQREQIGRDITKRNSDYQRALELLKQRDALVEHRLHYGKENLRTEDGDK
jgi:hypothetical protein